MGKRYLLSIGPFLLSAQRSFATLRACPSFFGRPFARGGVVIGLFNGSCFEEDPPHEKLHAVDLVLLFSLFFSQEPKSRGEN
jgi:hypothetical protein